MISFRRWLVAFWIGLFSLWSCQRTSALTRVEIRFANESVATLDAFYGESLSLDCSSNANASSSSLVWIRERANGTRVEVNENGNATVTQRSIDGGSVQRLIVVAFGAEEAGVYACFANTSDGVLVNASVVLRRKMENCSVCDSNAQCAILANGRANCTCRQSFVGDGRTCRDVNECLSGLDNCDPYANCVDTQPGFQCNCSLPYVGNGIQCDGGSSRPTFFVPQQPSRHVFFKGSDIGKTLACTASNFMKPELVWEKDGVLLDARPVTESIRKFYDTEYDIPNAAVNDSGTYVCILTTNFSSKEPNLTVRSPPIQILIEDPASVNVNPNTAVILQGNTVTLGCFGSGSPLPTLSWSYNGLDIRNLLEAQEQLDNMTMNSNNVSASFGNSSQASNESMASGGNETSTSVPLPFVLRQDGETRLWLDIRNITFQFAGQYTCTGQNNITSNRTIGLVTARKNATVEVEVPADFLLNPSSTSILLGGSLNITCSAFGNPDPFIDWLFNGIELNVSSDDVNVVRPNATSSTLMISNGKQDNEGQYSCRVYNNVTTASPVAKTSKAATIILEDPASFAVRPPPAATVLLDETLSLSCRATGIPTPSVTWTYSNGSSIMMNPGIVISRPTQDEATLSFVNATMDFAGNYACVATNEAGTVHGTEVRATTSVTVEDPYAELSCVPFPSGRLCSEYLEGVPIYYNSTETSFAKSYEIMGGFSRVFFDKEPTEACINFSYPLVCRYIFSPCKVGRPFPQKRAICKNDCETGQELCPIVWQLLTHDFVAALNTAHLGYPGCRTLSYFNGGDDDECIGLSDELDPRDRENTISTDTCVYGKGRGYNGTVSVTKSGYTCQAWDSERPHPHSLLPGIYPEIRDASNYCRNPGGRSLDGPWCYTTNRNVRWEQCAIPKCDASKRCEEYAGSACREYIPNGMKVFVNDGFGSQQELDGAIQRLLDTSTEDFKLRNCKTAFFSLMCGLAFPACDQSIDVVQPRRPCRESCEDVRDVTCPTLWNELSGLEALLNISPLDAPPNCTALPTLSAGDRPSCMISLPGFNAPNAGTKAARETSDCYVGDGQSYRGSASVTESGYTCQSWLAHYPHNHSIDLEFNFTSVGIVGMDKLRGGACRNPNGRGERPWCFTTDYVVRWEYCDINECIEIPTLSTNPSTPAPPEDSGLSGAVIGIIAGVGSGLGLLIVLLIVIVCCVAASRRRNKMTFPDTDMVLQNRSSRRRSTSGSVMSNPNYKSSAVVRASLAKLEFPVSRVEFLDPLGEGYFGKVFKGRAVGILADEKTTLVAVKTLKEGATSQSQRDFEHESCLLSEFQHDNIVRLLGVSMLEEPQCMIFEFMEHGDLNKFLHEHSPDELLYKIKTAEIEGTEPPDTLTTEDLVSVSMQVASGMTYLSERHYVHRDLATRNCLVGGELIVKIADFGMSQDIYSTDYYRVGDHAMLPVRWMPPEAIIYGKFTVESDVWSFGVVMWEVFTYAMQPYYGLSNEEVVERVRRGSTLERPDNCPGEIYDMMKRCWIKEPFNRPAFGVLEHYLRKWLEGSREVISPGPLMTAPAAAVPNPYQNLKTIRAFASSDGPDNGAAAANYDRPGPARLAYDNSVDDEMPPPPPPDDVDALPPPSPMSEALSPQKGNGFLDGSSYHPEYPNYARPKSGDNPSPLLQQDRSETVV